MDSYGDVCEANKRRLSTVPAAEGLDFRRRLVVRPAPNLVCAAPVMFKECDWSAVCCADWSSAVEFDFADGLHGSVAESTRGDCYTEVGYVNRERQDYTNESSSSAHPEKKQRCMAESVPTRDTTDLSHSNAFFDETSCDAGSLVPEGTTSTTQQTRHKYDAYIDPSLSAAEKKRQRRILANRASARRSRQKKKDKEHHLLQRELKLTQERDAAIQSLNEQMRTNMAMRRQLQFMREKLDMYEKHSTHIVSSLPHHAALNPTSMTETFLSLPMTTNETLDVLDPFVHVNWNLGSM